MKQQIALYLRLSQEDADHSQNAKEESNSIASQRMLLHRHLDQDPLLAKLPRIEFCDDGFSGTNFNRPGFEKMLECAKRGEICCIAVKDLSRFGRDYLEVGDYLEHIFPFLGIRFLAVNDRYDSAAHAGRTIGMDVAFKNLFYDYYSKDLSRKVRSAMEIQQKNTRLVNTVPYGYQADPADKHHLIPDTETAPIVRRIFQEAISGRSCTQIARELNAEGIPTPAQYKAAAGKAPPQWTHRTLLTILHRVKYTGTMVNHTRESRFLRDRNQRRVPKEEWYVRENAHAAIVTPEEYEQAQAAIRQRKKSARSPHDLSDRVYFCAHCGRKLEKANGTVFACPSRRYHEESPCENVRWRKSALEEILLEALKRQVATVHIDASAAKNAAESRRAHLERQLILRRAQADACDREKLAIYESYREGRQTQEEYLSGRESLARKQSALNQQLAACEAELETLLRHGLLAKERQESASRLTGLSDAALRAHLYDAVERVQIYDAETIEIVWKFSETKINP